MIRQGDCIDILPSLEAGSVDLIYADPPFNSGRDYAGKAGAFSDRFASTADYTEWMRPRLEEMWRVCGGSLYLHCDDTACHRLRCLLDDVCQTSSYRNSIVWKRSTANGQGSATFSRIVDYLLIYSRPDAIFNAPYGPHSKKYLADKYCHNDKDGRGAYRLNGLRWTIGPGRYFYKWKGFEPPEKGWVCTKETMERLEAEGKLVYPRNNGGSIQQKLYLSESKGRPVSNLWDDISALNAMAKERVGYPTQKPLALLERIVAASSNPGDLVFDPFCGSGTTLVAAQRLGRKWAGCDISADAVAISEKRLLGDLTEPRFPV